MSEVKPIPGWPGYFADALGNIYSDKSAKLRKLRVSTSNNGYFRVTLSTDGKRVAMWVHRLVCSAFHGEKPFADAEVCHNNGKKLDNRAENLRWDTHVANMADLIDHGYVSPFRGERHHAAKLTESAVLEIRERFKSGEGDYRSLAMMFGVHHTTIQNIVCRRTWRHID